MMDMELNTRKKYNIAILLAAILITKSCSCMSKWLKYPLLFVKLPVIMTSALKVNINVSTANRLGSGNPSEFDPIAIG